MLDTRNAFHRRAANAAETAVEHARRGRVVLIAARNAFEASIVFDAVQDAMARDRGALTVRRSKGLWHAVSTAWNGGRIGVRVQGKALHGLSADTVLRGPGLNRAALRDCRIIAHASVTTFVADW